MEFSAAGGVVDPGDYRSVEVAAAKLVDDVVGSIHREVSGIGSGAERPIGRRRRRSARGERHHRWRCGLVDDVSTRRVERVAQHDAHFLKTGENQFGVVRDNDRAEEIRGVGER